MSTDFLTVAEVARILRIKDIRQVHALIRKGEFTATRSGHAYLIPRESFEALLERHRVKADA